MSSPSESFNERGQLCRRLLVTEQITLYSCKTCPYAHRVELALEEAKAKYTRYEVDLSNKPEWYTPKVNPMGKVPALTYGGPSVPPDQPSPESVKLAESLVLLEFVADLFPEAHLLPSDPVLRAKARFFIDVVGTKVMGRSYFRKDSSPDELYVGLETIQALLPDSGFAVGEYSIADAMVAPHLARALVNLENDLVGWKEGECKTVLAALRSPRFARLNQYIQDLEARPNFKATFDKEYVTEIFKKRYGNLRAQA
ncbi:hypothetical protein CERSUDRAFT_116831 [Gelatoporia subvermispora B]|uniref:GST N-terminal domain-containing protein n=1 Tax=Ceriporiopsis subvermispora (strain B) TaxID=914234 RepID=M2PFE6_CERS8|nr:hypothetical protein CERSUDRAFT_116831 [Gelatoporia subvermispora B]